MTNTTKKSDVNVSSEILSPVKRLVSLDAFRGWTMFWIVGGGSIMTGLEDTEKQSVFS